MNYLMRIINFFMGRVDVFDDFDRYLINYLADQLRPDQRDILLDQISRFNKTQSSEYRKGKKTVKETFYYWKDKGRIRRDFPLLFYIKQKEFKLATVIVDASVGVIEVNFWLVDGALCSMEFVSENEELRPMNPEFSIVSTKIYIDQEINRKLGSHL